jgi:hypothetical protein
MKEAPGSSETSVLTRATRRNNPEDTILHSHRRENLKSYISEHRLSVTAMDTIPLSGFKLGARFCRSTLGNGDVCIYVHEIIHFTNIDVEKYCIEKNIEIYAARLHLPAYEICLTTIYRAPSGNLQQFFRNLDKMLNMISGREDIVICGDININYSSDSYHKQQLDSLLASYGLYSVIKFPTRI